MDIDLNAIGKWIAQNSKDISATWFSVLTRGSQAFGSIDLEKNSTLLYALKFMLCMAFADLLLHIPLAAKIGINVASGFFVVLFVAEGYLEYLATALILHGSMKLLGGKGKLQACIAAYCFLTAYMPIIGVLMLPTQMLVVPAVARSSNYIEIVNQLSAQLNQFSPWERATFLLSFLLTTIVFVLFFTSVFRQFRALHKLGKARAVFAFIGGLVSSAVFMVAFLHPLLATIYEGFAQHATARN
jgi:hypothetical protein